MTLEEVAEYLRVSERTVADWAQKGELPAGKLGTAWRFKRVDVERWVDSRLRPRTSAAAGGVILADVLPPERVRILDCERKKDALNALVDTLAGAPEVDDAEELRQEIFNREKLMSTGIGFGVAVPHVRLASVKDLVMAVAVNRRDLTDYASLDDTPVRIICMVAARADQHAQYLRSLAAVSGILKDQGVRQALIAAEDPSAIYTLLTQRPV
jgi:PTS system nitrogen regulatory IIA component